jgi:pimeloyl-ACP methyl ester carboxylesterase
MKSLGRLLAIVVVLVVVGGAVFFERPMWVLTQQTHFELFLARVQSNYVAMPEGRVHYYEGEPRVPGGGIPLVLVHGLADRDESWAPMLERLKRAGFHVYAPDLLGYGRSPKPADGDYSIATQEKFVADFISALGLQRPEIGGWSMGGWVVLKLAADHPELVDRVVVYDAVGLSYDPGHTLARAGQLFHPTNGAEIQGLYDLLEPHAKPIPPFVLRDLMRTKDQGQWVVDRSVAAMLTQRDVVDAQMPGLTEPLLIVWGSDDRLVPLSVGERFHALDPRSELDIVEGCGHLAPKTCPARVAQATADFLKAQPVPSGQVRTLTRMR